MRSSRPAPSITRTNFHCGTGALDRYFRELVTQDMRRRVANCFVALELSGEIAEYYTFAAASLAMTELRVEESKRLPRYPLLPAGLIGRLAADKRFRTRTWRRPDRRC